MKMSNAIHHSGALPALENVGMIALKHAADVRDKNDKNIKPVLVLNTCSIKQANRMR